MMRLISCIFVTAETKQISRAENFASWANLPPDLLHSIMDCLDIADSIRLSAVCTSWASTIRPCLPSLAPFRLNHHIPLLLLSAQNAQTDPNCTDLYFYNLATTTSYSVPIPIPIPSDCFCHCLGHKDGWLVTLDAQSRLHLIKPLTGANILLPSKGIYYELHLRKVILCRTPDRNNGFLAVCISQLGCLAFTMTGAESWTSMKDYPFLDVIVYKGKVYAIASSILSCWGFLGSSFRHERLISLGLRQKLYCWPKYLVEWRGELLMLIADKDPWFSFEDEQLRKVKLYKINLKGRGRLLSRVRNLGDDALFLGANHSYAVSTSGVDTVRGNCIYFADVRMQAFNSLGSFPINFSFSVFDLRKKTYKYKKCFRQDSPVHWQPPIWFRP